MGLDGRLAIAHGEPSLAEKEHMSGLRRDCCRHHVDGERLLPDESAVHTTPDGSPMIGSEALRKRSHNRQPESGDSDSSEHLHGIRTRRHRSNYGGGQHAEGDEQGIERHVEQLQEQHHNGNRKVCIDHVNLFPAPRYASPAGLRGRKPCPFLPGLDCSDHCEYGLQRSLQIEGEKMTTTPHAASELFRQEPERLLDVGIGEVAYRRIGRGPDVLFVHGWPVSGATFRTLLPHLADHVTCHVIDLPGAGSSRFTAETPLTIDGHIRAVRRVLDLLEFKSVALVGHDSGGLISRHAAAGDPRLRALGLIDTEPLQLGWRFRSFVAARHVPGFGRALGWVAGKPRVRRNKFVFGDAFADASLLDGEFDEFFLQPLHTSRAKREAALKVLKSFDLRFVRDLADIHPRITAPVKLVWGELDAFFPVAQAQKMVSSFPNAELQIVPGAGLFSHEERPEAVAAALLPTLTRLSR